MSDVTNLSLQPLILVTSVVFPVLETKWTMSDKSDYKVSEIRPVIRSIQGEHFNLELC